MAVIHFNAEILRNIGFQGSHFENLRWPLCGYVKLILHCTTGFLIPEKVCLAVKIMTLGHLDAEIFRNMHQL